MKQWILCFGALFSISPLALAVAAPTTCISAQFTNTGDQNWKTITLKLTNNCNNTVDFQNATITFKNTSTLNTSFWGNFSPLSYPDNTLLISSQKQSDG
ncbi:MAG TPA: hypothetical protein VHD33_05160, partial [Legionellaceae bacterium]|nr:hypothetical protein [Legionellaceae bacterium]